MQVRVNFRPLERETLELLSHAYEKEGEVAATYGRLLSAALMSAAIIGLSPEQVAQHAEACMEKATEAMNAHPEIFGEIQ